MALRDNICCKDCGCKVIYDGYDNVRDSLEAKWGDPDADHWTVDIVRCKPCFDKREAYISKLEAENERLKVRQLTDMRVCPLCGHAFVPLEKTRGF